MTALAQGPAIEIAPGPGRVTVRVAGVVIAESRHALVLREGSLPAVVYLPRADVREDVLRPSKLTTFCPFKGNARFWHLQVGDRRLDDAVWSYEQPMAEAAPLAGHMAFYPHAVTIDSEGAAALTAAPAPGTNPMLGWLLNEAPLAAGAEAITAGLVRTMHAAGVPLWRLTVLIGTLHPQIVGHGYRWRTRDEGDASGELHGELETVALSHAVLQTDAYRDSPFVPIYAGAGGIRRRLDVPEPELDYPILAELYAEGVSDYVAMPLHFSDGSIHALTLCTRRPGGFLTAELSHLYEVLAVLSRLYEVHARRAAAVNLLDTYLGRQSGERVLEGRIRRGDGEDIAAVIWFCDLRESTALAARLGRRGFLALLNEVFDAMAAPVLEHGGEVLRFIGDAALAIFPIPALDGRTAAARDAALAAALDRALAAVAEAGERMAVLNQRRQLDGQPAVRHGIGLHEGDVTYGNVGTGTRLEFTVIGEAANYAARVQGQCDPLGCTVLLSSAVARHAPRRFVALPPVPMRGLDGPQQLYTLAPPAS